VIAQVEPDDGRMTIDSDGRGFHVEGFAGVG
jgi:hypothetical protein